MPFNVQQETRGQRQGNYGAAACSWKSADTEALTLGNDEYSTSPVEQSFFRTRNLDDIYKILTELLWFRQVGANRCRLLEPRLL